MNPVPWLQMTNMISYQGLVRTFPKLCRPSEVVLDILPDAQKAAFTKEDGEKVVDDAGNRLK